MDLEIKGKVAIVTGASRGIGRAIADALAREGVAVLLVARDGDRLRAAVQQIAAEGGRAEYLAIDLRRVDAAEACIAAVKERLGGLDILVNNAGDTKRGSFFELSEQDWIDGFSLKFASYVRMARTAWPLLRAGHGSIINIIGSNARVGNAVFTIGGAVNSALVNVTKALADLGVSEGVRVNAINPGSIIGDRLDSRIGFVARTAGITTDEAAAKILADGRVSRFGRAEEIADAVLFLISRRAEFIQGAVIDIDGGLNRAI